MESLQIWDKLSFVTKLGNYIGKCQQAARPIFMLLGSGKEGTMKLRLKDGTAYPVLEGSTAALVKMELGSLEEVEDVRKALTKGNLAAFAFTSDAGEAYGEYECHVLAHVSYREEAGRYLADFALRELSDVELRLDALEVGQETQDGAIEELAGMMGGGE